MFNKKIEEQPKEKPKEKSKVTSKTSYRLSIPTVDVKNALIRAGYHIPPGTEVSIYAGHSYGGNTDVTITWEKEGV